MTVVPGRVAVVRAALLTLTLAGSLLVEAGPAVADPGSDAADVPTGTRGSLDAVTCVSEALCIAVGGAPEHEIEEQAAGLVDLRDAAGWHAKHVQPRDTFTGYDGVACPSATSCLAVGSDEERAQAATWDGTRWTVIARPSALGGFRAVSCPAVNRCVAVGYLYDTGAGAATWNGSTWTVTAVPSPAGATFAVLFGVSCRTPRSCLAVGYAGTATTRRAMSARFDGSTWTTDPAPSAPPGTTTSRLAAVDCATATSCVATGVADDRTLAEVWDGSAWTRVPTPPGADGDHSAILAGVSCPRPDVCLAVGSAFDPTTSTFQPLAQRWDGTTWTSTPPPTAPEPKSLLTAVTCTGPNWCVAVGWSETARPRRDYTLAERWTGARWLAEQS